MSRRADLMLRRRRLTLATKSMPAGEGQASLMPTEIIYAAPIK